MDTMTRILIWLILALAQVAGVIGGAWLAQHERLTMGNIVTLAVALVIGELLLVALSQWGTDDAKGHS
jgi:hypothetical protein